MSTSSLRVWSQSPERFFEAGFARIAQTRMKGLAINNPRLQVRAFGFERMGPDWLGCVVTPWSILVVLACGNRATWQHVAPTKVRSVTMPSGDYEFMGMDDPILGEYQVCSLMSPVNQLPDQRTAVAFAHQALWLMRQGQSTELPPEEGTALVPDPFIEKRAEGCCHQSLLDGKKL
ncbi:MAG: [NiFe]-hydrogenase assembly chaperone HybE [Burkholderiaceae bacterium]|nr:[NiFe]-hydrogenase assembly chaperone HybE [Burkholderiaceae bacterium]